MRLFCSAILLLVTVFSINTPCAATEIDEREAIAVVVRDAFAHDRFAEITALADRYRVGKSRTGGGLWKLTAVYIGIEQAINNETAGHDFEPLFGAVEHKVQRWIALEPKSPAAQLAYAHALVRHAWRMRGGGYASTVTPDGWKAFRTDVEKTRRYLEKTKAIAAIDPHWYEMMLKVANWQSWDDKRFGAMFDAAIAREPLFYQTWFAAVEYFLPKWQGNTHDVELFAQLAVLKTAATERTGMYARIYWYASQTQFGDDIFHDSLANWPTMKLAFDDVVARYPDAWNYNNYGKFACLARDKKSTNAMLAKIGDQPIAEAWDSPGLIKNCRAWAASGTI
jgi:hypothetical protein